MTHDLVATFTNSLGSEHDWTYKDVDNSLPAQTIKEACELLTTLDIFEQNGVKLFDSVVTAKIVTTTETIIFDKENELSTEEYTQTSTASHEKTSFPTTYPTKSVDNVDKPEENYSQAPVSVDKSTVQLTHPMTARNNPLSLIKNVSQIGKRNLTSFNAPSADASVEQSLEPNDQPKVRTKLIDRFLRKRKRKEKDPIGRPPDDISRS